MQFLQVHLGQVEGSSVWWSYWTITVKSRFI